MLILGIDGADYGFLKENIGRMPSWSELNDLGSFCHLESDAPTKCSHGSINSAPCWATAFTGLKPSEHKIWDYYSDRAHGVFTKSSDYNLKWLWNDVEMIAFQIPVFLPALYINCEVPSRDTRQGIIENSLIQLHHLRRLELREVGTLATVIVELDRIQHKFWNREDILRNAYERLGIISLKLIHEFEDFLLFSDHGFDDVDDCIKNGWVEESARERDIGHHAPDGILITNADGKPPKRLSEVCDWLRRYLLKVGTTGGEAIVDNENTHVKD